MKRVVIKQFEHDGLSFYYTDEAICSTKSQIGFYFDRLGFPQEIHKSSFYGGYILGAKNTETDHIRDSTKKEKDK